jgi:hypothetical protein
MEDLTKIEVQQAGRTRRFAFERFRDKAYCMSPPGLFEQFSCNVKVYFGEDIG